ncbi:MAG: hypothetical protein WKF75_12830, partial [Singulisphaera sp.]
FAIERRMIEANLHRRQLDALDRVRLARRMLEIGQKLKPGGLSQYAEQDLRDRIGAALGMSGRNVQRYLNILNAPMEVQRAHSEGRLSMKLAEKVARLDDAEHEEIAAEIRGGGDPAEVVAAPAESAPAEVDPDKEHELFLAAGTHASGPSTAAWRRCGGMDLIKRSRCGTNHFVDQGSSPGTSSGSGSVPRCWTLGDLGARPLVRPGPPARSPCPGRRIAGSDRPRHGEGRPFGLTDNRDTDVATDRRGDNQAGESRRRMTMPVRRRRIRASGAGAGETGRRRSRRSSGPARASPSARPARRPCGRW